MKLELNYEDCNGRWTAEKVRSFVRILDVCLMNTGTKTITTSPWTAAVIALHEDFELDLPYSDAPAMQSGTIHGHRVVVNADFSDYEIEL